MVFAFFAGASSGSSSRLRLDVVALGAADLAGAFAGSFLVAAAFFAGAIRSQYSARLIIMSGALPSVAFFVAAVFFVAAALVAGAFAGAFFTAAVFFAGSVARKYHTNCRAKSECIPAGLVTLALVFAFGGIFASFFWETMWTFQCCDCLVMYSSSQVSCARVY